MFEANPPYVEIFNPKGAYPTLKSFTQGDNLNREYGFKRHRITGAWLSSSLAVAERTLSPTEFTKYVGNVVKYLKLTGKRPPEYEKVPKWDLLRDYQKEGVQRLVEYRSTLLGDEMGLGKTVQVCIALQALGGSAVVVCPNHLFSNWCDELVKWTSDLVIDQRRTLTQTDKWRVGKGAVLVVPFSQIHKVKKLQADIMVVDEAHYLTNPKAKRTLAVAGIEASRRWLLSGTAFKNHPIELFSLLVILKLSEFFGGSLSGFALGFGLADLVIDKPESAQPFKVKKYRKKLPPRLVPRQLTPKRRTDFARLLGEVFYLRRNKADHLELPPKIRRHLKISPAKGLIKNGAKDFKAMQGEEVELNVGHVSEIAGLRIATAKEVVKSKHFKEYVEGLTGKTVFFAYHNEVLELTVERLTELGYRVCTVMRDTEDVGNEVKAFNESDDPKTAIVISIRKGSTGLTLTSSTRVCALELDWTVAELSQAEDRVHRFGQTQTTYIDYLTTEGGVDDYVIQKLITKEKDGTILK